MNTRQISSLLQSNPITRQSFVGVFPSDLLPKTPRKVKPCSYIANTQKHNQSGEHWVCFHFPQEGPAEFFDSYGFPPQQDFLKILGNLYRFSSSFFQFPISSACGQYCIFFILQRCSGKSMTEILNMFSTTDLLENDILVNSTVEEKFTVDLDIFDCNYIRSQFSRSFQRD
jgi:hypothetical protein